MFSLESDAWFHSFYLQGGTRTEEPAALDIAVHKESQIFNGRKETKKKSLAAHST